MNIRGELEVAKLIDILNNYSKDFVKIKPGYYLIASPCGFSLVEESTGKILLMSTLRRTTC